MKAIDFPSQRSTTLRFLAVILFPLMASVSYSETLIYRQTFGNATAQKNFSDVGIDWTDMYTKSGAPGDTYVYVNPNLVAGDVNVGAATGSATTGVQNAFGSYAFNFNWTADKDTISLYTQSLNLDPTANSYRFGWAQNNGSSASIMKSRVLVDVGGVWYISAATFQPALNTITQESFTYDPTASNWLVLSTGATPTNASITSNWTAAFNAAAAPTASSNLTGNITALGLMLTTDSGGGTYISIDSFSVYGTAIPEPTSLTLVAGCVAGFALLGLRRKRS